MRLARIRAQSTASVSAIGRSGTPPDGTAYQNPNPPNNTPQKGKKKGENANGPPEGGATDLKSRVPEIRSGDQGRGREEP